MLTTKQLMILTLHPGLFSFKNFQLMSRTDSLYQLNADLKVADTLMKIKK